MFGISKDNFIKRLAKGIGISFGTSLKHCCILGQHVATVSLYFPGLFYTKSFFVAGWWCRNKGGISKIDNDGSSLTVQHDVGRFDIAMDESHRLQQAPCLTDFRDKTQGTLVHDSQIHAGNYGGGVGSFFGCRSDGIQPWSFLDEGFQIHIVDGLERDEPFRPSQKFGGQGLGSILVEFGRVRKNRFVGLEFW